MFKAHEVTLTKYSSFRKTGSCVAYVHCKMNVMVKGREMMLLPLLSIVWFAFLFFFLTPEERWSFDLHPNLTVLNLDKNL